MLKALADGETDPVALATLGDQRLRATPAALVDALGACAELNPVYRRFLTLALEELQFIQVEPVIQPGVLGSFSTLLPTDEELYT